jgi:tetratricopeptide (TPR) repeat protein
MQHQSASFWADIKNLEERLAQDPDSYLFARLADVYLKVNLIDDALHTARQGVAKFPAYVAGQRALAMACYAKGLAEECREALEAVTNALPDDAEAQKMLARLLVACGDRDAAKKVFRVVLDFYPEDVECCEDLKALESPAQLPIEDGGAIVSDESTAGLYQPVEEICDEADEIIDLTEDDIWVEEAEAPVFVAPVQHDPLSTVTLAELYVQQGFVSKALEIYRALRDEDPTNSGMQSRIAELEAKDVAPAVDKNILVADESVPVMALQEPSALPPDIPVQGRADEVISTLEGWLDTIRRIKACR